LQVLFGRILLTDKIWKEFVDYVRHYSSTVILLLYMVLCTRSLFHTVPDLTPPLLIFSRHESNKLARNGQGDVPYLEKGSREDLLFSVHNQA
jgi:hypothetical protein